MHDAALAPSGSIARNLSDSVYVPFGTTITLVAVGFESLPSSLSLKGPWMRVPCVALGSDLLLSVANVVRWRASALLVTSGESGAARIVGVASASHANQRAIAGAGGATVIIARRFAESPSFTGSPQLLVPLVAFFCLIHGVPAAAGVERERKSAIATDGRADISSTTIGCRSGPP